MKKLQVSPTKAPTKNRNIKSRTLKCIAGLADRAPAAKSKLSPGKNGNTTAAVSIKITKNKIKYVQPPTA